jgi:hypothetical protein
MDTDEAFYVEALDKAPSRKTGNGALSSAYYQYKGATQNYQYKLTYPQISIGGGGGSTGPDDISRLVHGLSTLF